MVNRDQKIPHGMGTSEQRRDRDWEESTTTDAYGEDHKGTLSSVLQSLFSDAVRKEIHGHSSEDVSIEEQLLSSY